MYDQPLLRLGSTASFDTTLCLSWKLASSAVNIVYNHLQQISGGLHVDYFFLGLPFIFQHIIPALWKISSELGTCRTENTTFALYCILHSTRIVALCWFFQHFQMAPLACYLCELFIVVLKTCHEFWSSSHKSLLIFKADRPILLLWQVREL